MKYYKIKCGRMYDGLSDEIQENMEILTEGNLIKEVGKNIVAPMGTETIDLSNMTVTPGLIDAHVHLNIGDWTKRRIQTIYEPPAFKTLMILHNAKQAMLRGFTAVRYIGSNCDDDYGSVLAKRMINEGYFEGARLSVTPYYIGATGGHADASQFISSNPKISQHIWDQYPGYGCGADEFRDIVRTLVKFGADFIKMFATGGFSTPTDGPEDVTLTDEEMKSIIDTSHQLGKKVTTHSYTTELIWKQVNMGIDGIEHGALIDDPKLIEAMKEKKVEYVPTFTPYESIIRNDLNTVKNYPPEMQVKLLDYAEKLAKNRELTIKSGIEFGYGSDMVAVHHCYESGYEYETMLNAKIDPFRALKAATKVNAKIMNMEGKIAAISPGYLADIAAWKRDLLEDPKALLDCGFVMKDGIVYNPVTVE